MPYIGVSLSSSGSFPLVLTKWISLDKSYLSYRQNQVIPLSLASFSFWLFCTFQKAGLALRVLDTLNTGENSVAKELACNSSTYNIASIILDYFVSAWEHLWGYFSYNRQSIDVYNITLPVDVPGCGQSHYSMSSRNSEKHVWLCTSSW